MDGGQRLAAARSSGVGTCGGYPIVSTGRSGWQIETCAFRFFRVGVSSRIPKLESRFRFYLVGERSMNETSTWFFLYCMGQVLNFNLKIYRITYCYSLTRAGGGSRTGGTVRCEFDRIAEWPRQFLERAADVFGVSGAWASEHGCRGAVSRSNGSPQRAVRRSAESAAEAVHAIIDTSVTRLAVARDSTDQPGIFRSGRSGVIARSGGHPSARVTFLRSVLWGGLIRDPKDRNNLRESSIGQHRLPRRLRHPVPDGDG